MATGTSASKLRFALLQTLELQDATSAAYKQWLNGPRNAPLPPSIPAGEGGSYPTTQLALNALGEIVDQLRANATDLDRTLSRETTFQSAASVFGSLLRELKEIDDEKEAWQRYKRELLDTLTRTRLNIHVYIPVWIFVRQEYSDFRIGPVEFLSRESWLDRVERTQGCRPKWRDAVEGIWINAETVHGSFWSEIRKLSRKFVARIRRKRQRSTLNIEDHDIATVSRFARNEQRIACVEMVGFENREASRRALLSVRMAIDAMRVLVAGKNNRLLATSADSAPPRTVDRLSQVQGKGLSAGWAANYPGVGGAPGMAAELIENSADFRIAAGTCIKVTISPTPATENLPELSQRWSNATHWYGRACTADADFLALPMLGFAMDILCGGKEEAGIRKLTCALFQKAEEDAITADGTTLKKVVRNIYEWRSRIAHGSLLAVDLVLESERALAESFANAMLYEYAIALDKYRLSPTPTDDGERFIHWLTQSTPSSGIAPSP